MGRVSTRMGALLVAVLGVCSAGCDQDVAGGQTLGRFVAKGTRIESCADAGLLGAPPELKLHVFLRRVPGVSIQWEDDGGLLTGQLDPALNFTIVREVSALVRAASDETPECRLARHQQVTGVLEEDEAGEVVGFTAVRSDDYVPVAGSYCDDMLAAVPPLAHALPCSVSFELTAIAQ